ncbi:hypothetical protein ORL62_21590 [Bacillus cereus]|nr:hypothetical protein [Bacillus cereus]MDZ4410496.1 hypothetical protein [Bacillus cereus]
MKPLILVTAMMIFTVTFIISNNRLVTYDSYFYIMFLIFSLTNVDL